MVGGVSSSTSIGGHPATADVTFTSLGIELDAAAGAILVPWASVYFVQKYD
jgi:uncharacterized protein YhjY with autotransporter beta-barrel domain